MRLKAGASTDPDGVVHVSQDTLGRQVLMFLSRGTCELRYADKVPITTPLHDSD